MEFKGVLRVTVSAKENRSGQCPISVEFVGEGGIGLQTIGARLSGSIVLDAVAVVKGTSYKHTAFSPALQAAIIASGKVKDEAAEEESDAQYQAAETAKWMQRSKERMA